MRTHSRCRTGTMYVFPTNRYVMTQWFIYSVINHDTGTCLIVAI